MQVYIDGQPVPSDVVHDQPPNISFNQGDSKSATKIGALRSKVNSVTYAFMIAASTQMKSPNSPSSVLSTKFIDFPEARRSEPQQKWLRDYFVANVANPLEKQEKQDLATLSRGFDQLNREIPSTMVMSDMAKPRDTFVLKRGDYRLRPTKFRPILPSFCPLFRPTLRAIASLSPSGLSILPIRSLPESPSIIFGRCISASAS